MIYKQTRSISLLNKPDEVWMHNTNLMFAISGEHVEIVTIRETFFMQNLAHHHLLSLSEKGYVLVDNTYLFEIGGKNKSKKKIAHLENAFVVHEDIEVGIQNNIPLWLFGFLY